MASPPLLLLLLLLQALALLPSAAPAAPSKVTVGVVVPERDLRYAWAWPRVAPALQLALEALEPELRNASLAVHIAFAPADEDGDCSEESVLENTRELKLSRDPDVLLGLGCDYTEDALSHLASSWDLPLLSAGELDVPPSAWTTVNVSPADFRGLMFYLGHLSLHFNWNTGGIFVFRHQSKDYGRFLQWLRHGPSSYFIGDYLINLHGRLEEELCSVRTRKRVIYISGPPEMVQQMMRQAQAQNMTNGDYVFLYLDILGESLQADGHREAAKPWQSKEGQDSGGLREAFQVVQILTFHPPQTPEYQHFQRELILRAQRDFGVALNDSQHKNLVAGCFHDGLLLYIRTLIETLHEGGSKRDFESILNKMRSLEFQGVTGAVCNYKTNYDLWKMVDVTSGQYQIVDHYNGSTEGWKDPPLNDLPSNLSVNCTSDDKGECLEGLRELLSHAGPHWPCLSPSTPILLPPSLSGSCLQGGAAPSREAHAPARWPPVLPPWLWPQSWAVPEPLRPLLSVSLCAIRQCGQGCTHIPVGSPGFPLPHSPIVSALHITATPKMWKEQAHCPDSGYKHCWFFSVFCVEVLLVYVFSLSLVGIVVLPCHCLAEQQFHLLHRCKSVLKGEGNDPGTL
ncbi:atrial natriuretic peptide receptor 2-like [Paroedura picta]|uniref:atrial natriuretic peptide receptor 2-like n=1 Tax=Paroedura picta TaxID=143630 RepID=UPI004056B05B